MTLNSHNAFRYTNCVSFGAHHGKLKEDGPILSAAKIMFSFGDFCGHSFRMCDEVGSSQYSDPPLLLLMLLSCQTRPPESWCLVGYIAEPIGRLLASARRLDVFTARLAYSKLTGLPQFQLLANIFQLRKHEFRTTGEKKVAIVYLTFSLCKCNREYYERNVI